MRRVLWLVAVVLLWASTASAQIGPVDFFTDFTGASAGSDITTGILNTGTHGNSNHGGWAVNGTAPVGMQTAAHVSNCGLLGSVSVDGTTYATSNTSLSMAVDNANTLRYITASIPAVGFTNAVSLTCFTPNIGAFGGSGIWDILRYDNTTGGTNEIVQYSQSNCGGSAGFDLEVNVPANSQSTCVLAATGASYWVVLSSNCDSGVTNMAIFDSTGTQVGATKTMTQASGCTITSWKQGQVQTGTSTGSNTFEDWMVRWSGPVPFPLGPVTTTQSPVYWIAKSLANNTGSGTAMTTTKALDVPAGATIVAAISSENASMTCGGNCFTDSGSNYTFTMAAGNCNVVLAANGTMMVGYVTNAAAKTGLTFTATTNASTFRNIAVVVLSASSFDLCAKGTTSAGSADVVTAAFTPTLNSMVTQFGYITAGVAFGGGTNYFIGNTSATTSFAYQQRASVPASSQTGTLVQANTSSKWTVAFSAKPAAASSTMILGSGQ